MEGMPSRKALRMWSSAVKYNSDGPGANDITLSKILFATKVKEGACGYQKISKRSMLIYENDFNTFTSKATEVWDTFAEPNK